MDMKIRIGTRGSELALWQAKYVSGLIGKDKTEIVIIKTKGDKIQDLSFDKIEGKGFFTSADICKYLLSNHGLALLPGTDFYMPPEHLSCRIATVDYDGKTALKLFDRYHNKKEFIEEVCPNLKKGCLRLREFLTSL